MTFREWLKGLGTSLTSGHTQGQYLAYAAATAGRGEYAGTREREKPADEYLIRKGTSDWPNEIRRSYKIIDNALSDRNRDPHPIDINLSPRAGKKTPSPTRGEPEAKRANSLYRRAEIAHYRALVPRIRINLVPPRDEIEVRTPRARRPPQEPPREDLTFYSSAQYLKIITDALGAEHAARIRESEDQAGSLLAAARDNQPTIPQAFIRQVAMERGVRAQVIDDVLARYDPDVPAAKPVAAVATSTRPAAKPVAKPKKRETTGLEDLARLAQLDKEGQARGVNALSYNIPDLFAMVRKIYLERLTAASEKEDPNEPETWTLKYKSQPYDDEDKQYVLMCARTVEARNLLGQPRRKRISERAGVLNIFRNRSSEYGYTAALALDDIRKEKMLKEQLEATQGIILEGGLSKPLRILVGRTGRCEARIVADIKQPRPERVRRVLW